MAPSPPNQTQLNSRSARMRIYLLTVAEAWRSLFLLGRGQTKERNLNELTLRVNGQDHKVVIDDPNTPLLYALRDDLRLRGPKFGCGLGQCGACTVLGRRRGGALVRDPGFRCRGAADHDAGRSRQSRPAEPCTSGVHRRTGRTMRILHQWHDHGCDRAVVAFSTSARKRNSRSACSESLPVRQSCAGDRRGAAGGERRAKP